MSNPKFKERNAIRTLYSEKYELDKRHSFRWPRLKDDLEAYLNALLQITDRAVTEAGVPRMKGHRGLIYKSPHKKDKEDTEE